MFINSSGKLLLTLTLMTRLGAPNPMLKDRNQAVDANGTWLYIKRGRLQYTIT